MTIYNITGWGKGKTTSAIGIAARALGNGEKVLFAQFLKDGKDKGVEALKLIYAGCVVILPQGTTGFQKEDCTNFWKFCIEQIGYFNPDLIIFDELNVALDYDLIQNNQEVFEEIRNLSCDVYITGRINNHKLRHQMIEIADIATNCYCEAHNYNRICKKCGMEFNPHYEYCPICGAKLSKNVKAKEGREC